MKKCHAYLLLITALVLGYGCDENCGIPTPSIGPCPCEQPPIRDGMLFISDFESGMAADATCGWLSDWADELSAVSVITDFAEEPSNRFAELVIANNDGVSAANWSGGGLSLYLSSCAAGINISNFDTLLFDIKMPMSSRLEAVKVKLEDDSGGKTREVQVQTASFRLSDQWQTARIPLDLFVSLGANPQGFQVLDTKHVTRLVTLSVHNGTQPLNVDGKIGIDNIRFSKN